MKKLFLILTQFFLWCIIAAAVLITASLAWGAEKTAEPKDHTAKIVVDMPGKTQKQEVVVQTTQKAKINLIGNAPAKRLKR